MDFSGYLDGLTAEARSVLTKLAASVQAAAPEAEPGMSYGVPAFLLRGKPLVCFAAFKDHYGFYPLSPRMIELFADELTDFSTAKGTIRFPIGKPLPLALIEKIVMARVEEVQLSHGA